MSHPEIYQKILDEGIYLKEESSFGQFTGGFYTDVYQMPDGSKVNCYIDGDTLCQITTDKKQHPIFPFIHTETTLWEKK
jgi:hypothetical protein